MAASRSPSCVELEQLLGEVRDRPLHSGLGPQPVGTAEARQVGMLAAGVAADPRDLLHRHVDAVTPGKRELQEVPVVARTAATTEHPLVSRDAVVDVDDEIARRQALEDVPRDHPPQGLRPADADGTEQLPIGDEHEAIRAAFEAAVEAALDQDDGPRRRRLAHFVDDPDRMTGILQDLGQARRLIRGEDDPSPIRRPSIDHLGQLAGPSSR